MIAIPNMDKPKTCHECRLHSYDWGNGYVPSHDVCHPLRKGFNSRQFDGERQVDTFQEVHPDCPLIDIIECWECEYYNGHEEYCDIDHFAREHGFCYSGKRRNNGV